MIRASIVGTVVLLLTGCAASGPPRHIVMFDKEGYPIAPETSLFSFSRRLETEEDYEPVGVRRRVRGPNKAVRGAGCG